MRTVLSALLLIAAVCMPRVAHSASPPFTSARHIEAFRVTPRWEEGKASSKTWREQKIIAGPRPVPESTSRAIAEELQRVYKTDRPLTRCAFVARYGLRVRLASGSVDVLVCPHCSEVHFFTDSVTRSSSMSAQLLRLLKPLFPDYPLRENEA